MPTVPLAVELDRQSVPPVRVDSRRTVSSADTVARRFTSLGLSRAFDFTPDTLRSPTKTAGTSFLSPSAMASTTGSAPAGSCRIAESDRLSSSSSNPVWLSSTDSAKRWVASALRPPCSPSGGEGYQRDPAVGLEVEPRRDLRVLRGACRNRQHAAESERGCAVPEHLGRT